MHKPITVLFVPGIKTYPFYLWGWRKLLRTNSTIQLNKVRGDFYFHFQHKRCRNIIEAIKDDIISLKPNIVIAHSFGGILAKTAIAELMEHSVQVFCTMASPHGMQNLGVKSAKRKLQTPEAINTVPCLLSYGGTLDPIVLQKHSVLPGALHTKLPVEHMAFLLSATVRNKVLEDCIHALEGQDI